MKVFLKMVLAVICGLLIMGFIGSMISMIFVGIMAASAGGNNGVVLPREGVLKMDLSKITISEKGGSSTLDLNRIMAGNTLSQICILDAVRAVNAAAADPVVKLIYLKPDGASMEVAHMEELREALSDFRKSGKAIVSYVETPTSGSYYLASVADKVIMPSNAGASPMITGVGSQLIFLKDLLDRFGVNVQLIRHGKYKSAGEMYIKNSPSPENLQQNQEMIDSMWESLATGISDSRGIPEDSLNALIDNLKLNNAQDMLDHRLVDELMTREELRGCIASLAVKDDFSDVSMIPFDDYVTARVKKNLKAKNKIAVVYASGNIVEGEDPSNIAGDTFSTMLARLRKDENVKAVVLRVASPGGSVLASDKIKTEIDLLREKKPVIASYGAYAASGGYWISNSCDRIFTDRTTLTGSIGVFSMIPDLSKTAKDFLHVGVTTVGSSKHSDMYSLMEPLDDAETAYMQASIEEIYERFVSTVAEGRELSPTFVDSIAQGRVWTGADAKEIGLVDEIGTFKDALVYAAATAGDADLAAWNIVSYPRSMTMSEMLMLSLGKQHSGADRDVFGGRFDAIRNAFEGWNYATSDRFYARLPYEYVIQ